jgi:hypothetical protein
MMNSTGRVKPSPFLDYLKVKINIRYKRNGNNDQRRVPADRAGKYHAYDDRERSGIDDMLDEHVLKRLENKTIKGRYPCGGSVDRWMYPPVPVREDKSIHVCFYSALFWEH